MDFDPYAQLAEECAFEENYALEMDMLNDIEVQAPSNEAKGSQGRRRLFDESEAGPSTSTKNDLSYEDIFGGDLSIEEEPGLVMPESKRARTDYPSSKKYFLPTTLDDDWDEIQLRKELKQDSEGVNPPAVIQRILDFREKRTRDSEEFLKQGTSRNGKDGYLQIRKVLEYPPVHSDFMSATSSDGRRCYMRIRSQERMDAAIDTSKVLCGKSLIPQNIAEMRQEIQIARDQEFSNESRRITEEVRKRNLMDAPVEAPGGADGDASNRVNIKEACSIVQASEKTTEQIDDDEIYIQESSVKNGLWLDKFAPTQYTHLLSEEDVNRSLLRWLKMWDFVVFGRKVQRKDHKPKPEIMNNMKKPFLVAKKELDERTDDYERPFFKAALLYGPPGLGKTTLAHIIAKHAGYHVVEMNASDDRSAEIFRNKIQETTQMKSVLGQDERPNCLIIDEIDGAPQAAIDALLAAMNKTRKKDEKKGKKKGGANNILLRPIICICNDLYVPSLRLLRQQSFILNFPPTRPSRLASRLAQLCRTEMLQCDMSTLLKLCEKTDNDIRSCVNTLQFVKASKQDKLNPEAVNAFQIGQKDQHKNIFRVWQEIFQLPKNKRDAEKMAATSWITNDVDGQKSNNLATRFYNIHHLVSANGDYEKTFQGVHENYLKMKFKDHDLAYVNKAQEWIQFYDQLSHLNQRLQDWSVLKFHPYLFVLFHMLFSCINVPKLSFPSQSFEAYKNRQKSDNLLKTMFMEMKPTAQCFTSTQTAVIDTVPYILSVMTPVVRPVNLQLYTPTEKKMLQDLVTTMITYNLSFQQRRNEDGQYDYVLEPNVTEICEYQQRQDRIKLPYSTRQLIAKEVEMERMRRSDRMIEGTVSRPDTNPTKGSTTGKKDAPKAIQVERLEDRISNAHIPQEEPIVDFFSRFTKVKKIVSVGGNQSSKKAEICDPGIGNSQVWYKFHEGSSNAVRQTVYVKDFL